LFFALARSKLFKIQGDPRPNNFSHIGAHHLIENTTAGAILANIPFSEFIEIQEPTPSREVERREVETKTFGCNVTVSPVEHAISLVRCRSGNRAAFLFSSGAMRIAQLLNTLHSMQSRHGDVEVLVGTTDSDEVADFTVDLVPSGEKDASGKAKPLAKITQFKKRPRSKT
jgi:hypothetical protein